MKFGVVVNFAARINRLQAQLQTKECDCAIILQDKDLYYYSGTAQNAHLIVPAREKPLLLVKKDFERAKRETAVIDVEPLSNLRQLPDKVAERLGYQPSSLGFELDVLPTSNYKYYKKLFPNAECVDISTIIRQQRMVKDNEEVRLIRKAGQVQDEVYQILAGLIREGMTEVELAALIEMEERKRGYIGVPPMRGFNQTLYHGQILSGKSGGVPSGFEGPAGGLGLHAIFPQGPSWKEIKRNEPIFIDHIGYYFGYMVDMTRVFSLGPLPPHLASAHQSALDIQSRIIEEARPGVSCEKIYDIAVEYAERKGLGKNFLGYDYTLPFVGHGVGLEVDELPVLARRQKSLLCEGAVVAIEPKFVFPGEGIVGIENAFLVTADGLEKLTNFSDELCII